MSRPDDACALLVRASGPDSPPLDLMGDWNADRPDPRTLILQGRLRRGLYEIALATEPGTFSTESLMLDLVEWPTRARVPAGPFDFDHTTYRMVVPTFRVVVDGRDVGLAWCEVPRPEDMRDRRVRGVWGIAVETIGPHEIRLEIPEGEDRLRWTDLARLEIRPDDRRAVPVKNADAIAARRPRLLTDAKQLQSLRDSRDAQQETLLADLRRQLEDGTDGTYVHRAVTAALVGLVDGESRWIEEAIQRTLALCEQPVWGYHDVPEIMGWNNDRDTGVRMYEAAVVYDLLRDHLDEKQRERLQAKLAYHADIAYQVTTLQKDYWYRRCAEAHGQGFWYGFAAAAIALLDEEPMAREWLEWIHGNLIDALDYLPEDGISEWLVFNVQWHILSVALFEQLTGRKLRGGPYPFLQNFARRIVGYVREEPSPRPVLGTLLFYLARRQRDGVSQANAFRASGLTPDGSWEQDIRPDPLMLLAYDPTLAPGKPSRRPLAVNSQSGHVICRSKGSDTEFVFRCGTPLTPRKHGGHHWMNRAWYHAQHAGSFSWRVGDAQVVPITLTGYRQRSADSNLITVDGVGNPTEGRWLGYDIELWDLPFIEQFAGDSEVTYCCGNLGRAYTAAAGVRHCSRRWVYFHEFDVVAMLDRIVTAQPRDLAWHLHANRGRWQPEDDFRFRTATDNVDFRVEAVWARIDGRIPESMPAAMSANVRRPQFVPPYPTGINTYKTLEWQPEVHGSAPDIPPYWDLQFAPMGPTRDWELFTVMGPGEIPPVTWRLSGGATIAAIGEAAGIKWRRDGGVPIISMSLNVTADLVVRIGGRESPRRWLAFGVTEWVQDGARTVLDAPGNLVWKPGYEDPIPLA